MGSVLKSRLVYWYRYGSMYPRAREANLTNNLQIVYCNAANLIFGSHRTVV